MGGVAIYGFGRIGRSVLKAGLASGTFIPDYMSDVKDPDTLAAIFSVDTNYGRWPQPVTFVEGKLIIGNTEIGFLDSSAGIPDWGALDVDLVIDCSGRGTTRQGAEAHIERGARTVLVSAPSRTLNDSDAVLLAGINLHEYDPRRHHIISMASCTTNALAPMVKVIGDEFDIESGFFTTVHAYTNTQSLRISP